MNLKRIPGLGLMLVGISLITWAGVAAWQQNMVLFAVRPAIPAPTANHTPRPTPLWQAEPLVPTAAPVATDPVSLPGQVTRTFATSVDPIPADSSNISPPSATHTPTIAWSPSTPPPALPSPSLQDQERFGVGVPYPPLEMETAAQLNLGWYLAWQTFENPPRPGDTEFWQMIRLRETGFHPNATTIQQIAQANPGSTWLIGNEPDVIWQDNVTPARYAEWYHLLYHLLKETDPDSQVAIGGITQPTPLRLQYLEQILSSYQVRYDEVMPVDVWNIHNFILREERDSWGVDIPPGLETHQGTLFEVADHDNLEIFKAQIINFRQWMVEQGQRNKPLIVSEYGILMPADYGFDPEQVKQFLYGTYDFMLNTTDETLGYPADGNRLVQRWAWYSLSDNRYPTGNLIDRNTGALTDLGNAHREYMTKLPEMR